MVNKKVTDVSDLVKKEDEPTWKPSAEGKSKATSLRVFAAIAWVIAILAQLGAIYYITSTNPIKLWIPIVIMLVDVAFAITGGMLWKRSNHIDPPSEANKILFFIQSQLGLVIAIIAFLPLIIVILTSKNVDKKQKGILTAVAVVLMGAAGIMGTDFHPASVEKYQAQTDVVKNLTGQDKVYGTKSGAKYHLYEDCRYLKSARTKELFTGSVADLHAKNSHIGTDEDALCSVCEARALKEKNWTKADLDKAVKQDEKD